ncbi:hypothetical protein [Bacteroides nordii]
MLVAVHALPAWRVRLAYKQVRRTCKQTPMQGTQKRVGLFFLFHR